MAIVSEVMIHPMAESPVIESCEFVAWNLRRSATEARLGSAFEGLSKMELAYRCQFQLQFQFQF